MTDGSEIQIGDNLCFVAKDPFISSTYSTFAIHIENDEDLSRIDDFFNNIEFVHAFRADTLEECIKLANQYIKKKQKERLENLGEIHRDKPKFNNTPGFNSTITDARDPDNVKVIKAIPQQ